MKTGTITKGNFIEKLEAHLEKFLYLYAFLIPLFIQIVLFAIYSIFPFGDQAYLRMDCYHQYAPFLKEFYTRMHNGEGLFFAWENGLGVNYWAHYAYYLSSPLNLLYLLCPKKYLLECLEAGMILKGCLASVSFLYYLNARFTGKNYVRLAFAVFYGLSAFMLAYSCNVMWPECYILFPLIMLGVEKIAKGENANLYGIMLCLSVFANFYISIIAGIAIVLYFIANLIIHAGEGKTIVKIGRFVLTTVVVVCICAIFLLPVFLCLNKTIAGGSEFPKEWEAYFNFHELLGRMLMNVDTIQNNSDLPNVYASLLALILTFLYFANPGIGLKSKITKGVILVFLLFSFQWNILTYVWHGFHFPNSFPGRQSFFFIFLLLSMGAECYEKREHLNKIAIIAVTAFMLAGCGALWFFLSKDDLTGGITTYLCSILILMLYGLFLFLPKMVNHKIVTALLLVVALIECTANTLAVGINSTVSRADYVKDEEITAKTVAYLDEVNKDYNAGFYRIEEYNRRYMNEAAWDGYKGASYFSSTIQGGVKQFYQDMGSRSSDVAYSFQGATPFMTSLLGVKYILSGKEEAPGKTFEGFEFKDGEDVLYVYENLYPLSVGFAVPKNADYAIKFEDKRPFRNENALCEALLEEPDAYLFKILPVADTERNTTYNYGQDNSNQITGSGTLYRVPAGRHAFFYVNEYIDSVRILIQDENRNTVESKKESDLKFRHILDLGTYEEDRFIVFIDEDEPNKELSFQAYCFEEDTYIRLMEKLSSEQLEVTSYSPNGLKGKITCNRDETLFFSIPYDSGFTITVDGEKVEAKTFRNAFLSVPIGEGEHEVELKYVPPGFRDGAIVSACGLLIAGILLLAKKKKH